MKEEPNNVGLANTGLNSNQWQGMAMGVSMARLQQQGMGIMGPGIGEGISGMRDGTGRPW